MDYLVSRNTVAKEENLCPVCGGDTNCECYCPDCEKLAGDCVCNPGEIDEDCRPASIQVRGER